MKEKMLIKVVATANQEIAGRVAYSTARGISPLKRGVTANDFISSFLEERQVTTYSLYQRSDDTWATSPITMLDEPNKIMTYHFVQFPANELGFNAKDLTTLELERDMKQITKFING